MSSLECANILDNLLALNLVSHFVSTLSTSDQSSLNGGEIVQTVGLVVLSLVSMTLLLFGYLCIRPMAGILLGALAFFVSLETTDWVVCEARLIISLISGICALLFTLCLLRTGLFLIGATTFGMTGYVVSKGIVPNHLLMTMGSGGGLSVIEWGIVGVCSSVGAFVVYRRKDRVYTIASSLLGSAGICMCISIVAGGIPLWSMLLVFSTATLGGVGCQYVLKNRQRICVRRSLSTAAVEAVRVTV